MDIKKLKISIFSGLMAAIIQMPQTFALTNKILPFETFRNGCSTIEGKLFHLLVFFAVTYLSMKKSNLGEKEILNNTIFSTMIYYFIFSSDLILLLGKMLKLNLVSNGCVNLMGMTIQMCLYILSLYGIMFL